MTTSDKPILLVEDNEDDITLTKRAFSKANIPNELVVARDGIEALEYLNAEGAFEGRDPNEVPALILLDLNMPRMGGLEFLKVIRNTPRTKLLQVVILTTSSNEADVVNGYELGANSYIRKPVDYDLFAYIMEQLGNYWLVLNVPAAGRIRE
jgi:two-component system response regulator